MLPFLTFFIGLFLGLLPSLRRTWRFRQAADRGIETVEMSEDEIIGLLERHVPRVQSPRLRRAK